MEKAPGHQDPFPGGGVGPLWLSPASEITRTTCLLDGLATPDGLPEGERLGSAEGDAEGEPVVTGSAGWRQVYRWASRGVSTACLKRFSRQTT